MTKSTPITVAYGDGIGPEIMEAVLKIISDAGAKLEIETIEVGEKIYEQGHNSGISNKAWESIYRNKTFLKAPITTPQGGGYKSLNVTIRKTLGLFANVRPARAYHPFIKTNFPDMDLVIVRENEEDLYAGIEYQLTDDAFQSIKLISRPGCERINRYAFDYAKSNGRKKVSCFVKDNIMKMTDGLFHKIFREVAEDFPQIETDNHIIDIACARVAAKPEQFDVIVTENLYGDIVSDIAAEISGSVGLGGSANIGDNYAMFEAIHGSAPTISGQDKANPSGLLNAAVMMLVHIGQPDVAALVKNAWLKTIEDGVHTYDISSEKYTKKIVGTKEFADAVCANIGKNPSNFPVEKYASNKEEKESFFYKKQSDTDKEIIGVDLFVECDANNGPDDVINKIKDIKTENIELNLVSMRGLKYWPHEGVNRPNAIGTDFARCRFKSKKPVELSEVVEIQNKVAQQGIAFAQAIILRSYGGVRGYSLAQGES